MKVADIMETQVEFVDAEFPLSAVARLIFGRGINGVPVCKGKKVVGFITERDILAKFYPSMQEYMEDPIHCSDFEGMEKKIDDILHLPANKIMSHNPTTITADTPLLKGQSMMMTKKIGRLPVVDEKGNLVGILSKGDIFKAVVGEKLPFEKDEKYHDWLSRRYDTMVDWETRLEKEIPDLVSLFKKENVKNILDVGCGLGLDVLAIHAYEPRITRAIGVDSSQAMITNATRNAPPWLIESGRIVFQKQDAHSLSFVNNSFDATYSDRTFQHLKDPSRAFRELVRVTKTGGKIVIADTDWGTLQIKGVSSETDEIIRSTYLNIIANPRMGGTLQALFIEHGLADVEVLKNLIELLDSQTIKDVLGLEGSLERARINRILSREDVDQSIEEIEQAQERAKASVAIYIIKGIKS